MKQNTIASVCNRNKLEPDFKVNEMKEIEFVKKKKKEKN